MKRKDYTVARLGMKALSTITINLYDGPSAVSERIIEWHFETLVQPTVRDSEAAEIVGMTLGSLAVKPRDRGIYSAAPRALGLLENLIERSLSIGNKRAAEAYLTGLDVALSLGVQYTKWAVVDRVVLSLSRTARRAARRGAERLAIRALQIVGRLSVAERIGSLGGEEPPEETLCAATAALRQLGRSLLKKGTQATWEEAEHSIGLLEGRLNRRGTGETGPGGPPAPQ